MKSGVDFMGYIAMANFQSMVYDDFTGVLAAFIISIILFFAMMIYYKIRILRLEQYIDYLKDQNKAMSEVGQIAKKIEEDLYKNEPRANNFEDEQEQKAIISYEELLVKEKPIDPYRKPVVEPSYTAPKPIEQIKLVPQDIREQAIKEKPVVRENQEFLNSLKSLRSNLK